MSISHNKKRELKRFKRKLESKRKSKRGVTSESSKCRYFWGSNGLLPFN